MNQKIKNRWTEALRSGKYRQGCHGLARLDNNKHLRRCCLGVLCEVAGAKRTATSSYATYTYGSDVSTCYPPNALAEEVGISSEAQNKLASMNDNHGKTFREIADWIDANL